MPRIVADLHGLDLYPLAFGALFASFLIFLPFAGPLADRYGTRLILSIALGLLAGGLAFAAIAPTMPVFLGARFVQGIGDGLDYAVSFAAIAKTFPDALRVRMLALNSAMWVVPALIGPGLGAYVATVFGWRWAFAGLIPLLIVAAALILPAVDALPSEEPIDPFGALRLLFSRATLRVRTGVHGAFVAFALLHAVFFGADAYVALMLTVVRGISLEAASICITLAVLGWSSTAFFSPKLLARFGTRRLVFIGAAGCIAGTVGLLLVALGAATPLAFAAWLVAGAGIGLAYPILSAAALTFAPDGREGAISSAMLLAGIVGLTAGILACGVPVTLAAHSGTPLQTALVVTFAIAALFGVLLALVSLRLPGALEDRAKVGA